MVAAVVIDLSPSLDWFPLPPVLYAVQPYRIPLESLNRNDASNGTASYLNFGNDVYILMNY